MHLQCHRAELFTVAIYQNGLVNPGCLHKETESSIVYYDEFAAYIANKVPHIHHNLGTANLPAVWV